MKESIENITRGTEETFRWYLEDFDLAVEDLKDKTILDVGAGMIPGFVEYSLRNGITDKIYAIDHWPFGHEIESFETLKYTELYPLEEAQRLKSKKHYIQAESAELPIKKDIKFDLILMRATLGHEYDPPKLIRETTSYLKPGGELRIAPVWKEGPDIEDMRKAVEKLDKNDFKVEWKEGVIKRENVEEEALLLIIRKQ